MKTAVLIIGHGSDEADRGSAPELHSARVQELTGFPTFFAYLHASPKVSDVMSKLASDGFEEVVAVPLFYSHGFIADRIVPESLGLERGAANGEAEVSGKKISIRIAGTFGDSPNIGDVYHGICRDSETRPESTDVLLISHGSKKGDATPVVESNADVLRKEGYRVLCAYNEFQHPTVEEGLAQLLDDGNDILAVPVFVSPSHHSSVEVPGKLGLDAGKRTGTAGKVKLTYTEEVGMRPEVADIVADRVREALSTTSS